jgi:hypothetical protein
MRYYSGSTRNNSGLSPGYAGLIPDLTGLWYGDAMPETGSSHSVNRTETLLNHE